MLVLGSGLAIILSTRVNGRRKQYSSPFLANALDVVQDRGECVEEDLPSSGRWRIIKYYLDKLNLRKYAYLPKCWFEQLSNFFLEDLKDRPVSSLVLYQNDDVWELLRQASNGVYPEFFNDENNLELYGMKVCRQIPPDKGMKETNKMIDRVLVKPPESMYFSRFLLRAEDRIACFRRMAAKNIEVNIVSPKLKEVIEGTRREFEWISKLVENSKNPIEDHERVEILASFGVDDDPIYAWRKDGNDDPHVLGNVLTRYLNLLAIGRIDEENQFFSKGKCKLWQYDDDYKFGGTFTFSKPEKMREGLVLIKDKDGPGRVSMLYKVKKGDRSLARSELSKLMNKAERLMDQESIIEEIALTKETGEYLLKRDTIRSVLDPDEEDGIYNRVLESFSLFDNHQSFADYDQMIKTSRELRKELCICAVDYTGASVS